MQHYTEEELYTFWRRTNPPPSLSTFDAPLRSSCIVQRQKTSTPLQALVLLNDPQFTEAAKVLYLNAMDKYTSLPERIRFAYRSLTGRKPSGKEISILEKLYSGQLEKFKAEPGKSKGWIHAGAYKVKFSTGLAELAAGAVIVSVIMNSDAFIMKR